MSKNNRKRKEKEAKRTYYHDSVPDILNSLAKENPQEFAHLLPKKRKPPYVILAEYTEVKQKRRRLGREKMRLDKLCKRPPSDTMERTKIEHNRQMVAKQFHDLKRKERRLKKELRKGNERNDV